MIPCVIRGLLGRLDFFHRKKKKKEKKNETKRYHNLIKKRQTIDLILRKNIGIRFEGLLRTVKAISMVY